MHVRNKGSDAACLARHETAAQDGSGPRWHTILVRPDGEHLGRIAELLASGQLRVHIAAVMPLEEVARAHQLVEAGHAGGKVVLKVV